MVSLFYSPSFLFPFFSSSFYLNDCLYFCVASASKKFKVLVGKVSLCDVATLEEAKQKLEEYKTTLQKLLGFGLIQAKAEETLKNKNVVSALVDIYDKVSFLIFMRYNCWFLFISCYRVF